MKYRCNQCDITFEASDTTKIRCPQCMGIHDVEPENGADSQTTASGKPPFVIPALILLAVIILAIVYFIIQKPSGGSPQGPNEISKGALEKKLEGLGIPLEKAIVPFEVTPEITSFAQNAVDGKEGKDALTSLQTTIMDLKTQKKWTPLAQNEPSMNPPLAAGELLAHLLDDNSPSRPASSYEISVLLLAAGKSIGLDNLQLAEIFSYKGEKQPADPNGIYGRYGIAMGTDKDGAPHFLLDPWIGRVSDTSKTDSVLLSSQEATAPYYAHKSLSEFAKMDLANALKENEIAIKLSPNCAMYKIHRGKIFISSGALQEGLAEFEKAKKIKDWAVSKAALAQISMMTDMSGKSAEADILAALEEFPDYYQARIILATIHIQRRDLDAAKEQLAIAQQIAPSSPEVAFTYAQFHLLERDTDKAIEMAQKGVRLSKESYQSLLILAKIYQATARFEEMRETAQKAISKIASPTLASQLRTEFSIEENDDEPIEEDNDTDTSSDDQANDELKLQYEAKDTPLGGGNLRLGNGNDNSGFGKGLKLKLGQ